MQPVKTFILLLMQPIYSFLALCSVDISFMNKTLLLIVVYTVLLSVKLYAQSREDVVYLYNGSILKGKVIENIPGVKTSIEIVGRNIIVLPDTAIKMILMNQKIPSNEYGNSVSPVEMAANVNFYGGTKNSGAFTFITSYRFPFRLSVGAGLGIEWFDHQQIPYMADFTYCFMKGSWSPYVYARTGYAVPLSKKDDGDLSEYYGGVLAGTGAGIRFNFSKRNALVFSIGYRYQKTKTVTGSYPWSSMYPTYETIRYDEFSRLAFSFGFLFN
jgi:hypothetical protein